MGKGSSGQNTVVQQSQPPAQFLQAYSKAQNRAQNVASQPLQQYSGSLLAGFTPMQEQAFGEIAGAQGLAQPYISQAANYLQNAGQPITITPFSSGQVNQYMSPFTQDVTSSLQNLFNQQNATQQSQVTGNLAAQGAYGGDRTAVAQALMAGQQQAQEAPVLSSTLQSGYNTGLGEFNAQQQAALQAQEGTGWLQQGAGYGLANLGQEALGSALTGAQAELGAGGEQQSLAQQALNIPYEQFTQQQAYPFQTAGWLANIAEGLGGASGGSSSTTYPGPSIGSEILGGGLAGAGLLGMTGAFGSTGYLSGLLGGGAGTASALGSTADATAGLWGGGGAADVLAGMLGARHGGRIGRQSGGSAPATGTSLSPAGLALPPDVSISVVPSSSPSGGGGMRMPSPPQDPALANQNLSPMQIVQMLNSLKGISGLSSPPPSAAASARGGRAVGGPAPISFPTTTPSRSLSNAPEFNYAPSYNSSGQPIGMKMVGSNYSASPLDIPVGHGGALERGQVSGGDRGSGVHMDRQYFEPRLGEQAPTPQTTGSAYPNSVFGSAAPQAPSETPAVGVPPPLASLLGGYGLPSARGGRAFQDGGSAAGSNPQDLLVASMLGDSRGGRATAFGGSVGLDTAPGEGFQAGGSPSASPESQLMAAGQAATGGASPMIAGLIQQYASLPTEQLQELAMRVPPNSPYGAAVQAALQQKHMNPGTELGAFGNAPTAPAPAMPSGLAAPPPPAVQPVATAAPPTLGQQQQQHRGGRAGYQGGGDIQVDPNSGIVFQMPESGAPDQTGDQPPPPAMGRTVTKSPGPNPAIGAIGAGASLAGAAGSALAPPPAPPRPTAGLSAPPPAPDQGDQVIPSAPAPRDIQPSYAGPSGEQENSDPRGLTPYIAETAQKYGVDPFVALKVAQSEGLGKFSGDNGTSFGAFQLHTHGGLGDEFQKETGLDPSDPKNEHATIDWALSHVGQTGWGPYHGARLAGIGNYQGIGGAPAGADEGDQVVKPGAGGLTAADITGLRREAADLETRANAPLPQHERPWTASPWMALLATGAGMMASRSPFPGVAIGEGLETGIKTAEAGEQEDTRRELEEARAGTIAEQAKHMADMADAAQQRINLTQQNNAARQQAAQEEIEVREASAASLEREREAADYYRQQARIATAGRVTYQAAAGPDPNDPSKTINGVWKYHNEPDPKTGEVPPPEFIPGRQPQLHNNTPITQSQYGSLVQRQYAAMHRDWANSVDPNKGPAPTQQQAQQSVDKWLAGMPGGGGAPGQQQQPAGAGTAPAPQTSAVQHPDRMQGGYLFRWQNGQYTNVGPAQQQQAATP